MSVRVLVVPDKFKGTLTAAEAACAIARGWRASRPGDELDLLPMSDGGDGFGEVLGSLLGAEARFTKTVDAANRAVDAAWWWHAPIKTAVIESARVIGLAMLPPGRFHPFELDTRGLGALLREASDLGAQRCLVGIGGSATNDGGFGVARSLGWQFFNAHEEPISRWSELFSLAVVRPPEAGAVPLFPEFTVAVDVQNPLLGPNGCSRIYGPQKGLKEFDFAERCLGQLARVLGQELHINHADAPGAGAAGGLGFGLQSFAGARLEPGFRLFAQVAGLEERVRHAQIVITGEGAIDASTGMGKGVGEIAALCSQSKVPCIGLAGTLADSESARGPFTAAHGLLPEFATRDQAMNEPSVWLEKLAAKAASEWRAH